MCACAVCLIDGKVSGEWGFRLLMFTCIADASSGRMKLHANLRKCKKNQGTKNKRSKESGNEEQKKQRKRESILSFVNLLSKARVDIRIDDALLLLLPFRVRSHFSKLSDEFAVIFTLSDDASQLSLKGLGSRTPNYPPDPSERMML